MPLENLDLHRLRCEKIDKSRHLEEIKISYNEQIECQICNNKFLVHEVDEHLCMCEYCGNSFEYSFIRDHMQECGNRTEFCGNCNSFILKKNYKLHVQVNSCRRPERPKRTKQELKTEVLKYIRQ